MATKSCNNIRYGGICDSNYHLSNVSTDIPALWEFISEKLDVFAHWVADPPPPQNDSRQEMTILDMSLRDSCRIFSAECFVQVNQEPEISPKRKSSGRISRRYPGVTRADIPGQNFALKKSRKARAAARTSMTRRPGDVHDPKGLPKTSVRRPLA